MSHEEPNTMSGGEKAAQNQKLSGERAVRFAKRRAAAKKAAATRLGMADHDRLVPAGKKLS